MIIDKIVILSKDIIESGLDRVRSYLYPYSIGISKTGIVNVCLRGSGGEAIRMLNPLVCRVRYIVTHNEYTGPDIICFKLLKSRKLSPSDKKLLTDTSFNRFSYEVGFLNKLSHF